MIKFTATSLENKSDRDISKILAVSFEYLIAGVADVYSKIKGVNSIEEFNQRNAINKPIASSYPFFVALSNGHGQSLYNLFGNFFSYSFGPVSQPIFNLIDKNLSSSIELDTNFNFFEIKPAQIKTKETDPKVSNFSELKEVIKNYDITLSTQVTKFKEIYIRNDKGERISSEEEIYYTPLYAAIDNGIDIISTRTNKMFFDGSLKRIMDFSIYYNSLARRYYKNAVEVINYSDIESPQNRAIYNDKPVSY